MTYEVIAEFAIYEYSIKMLNEVQRVTKTLRRLHPHDIPWYKRLLINTAEVYRLNKKMVRGDVLIYIYPAPKP